MERVDRSPGCLVLKRLICLAKEKRTNDQYMLYALMLPSILKFPSSGDRLYTTQIMPQVEPCPNMGRSTTSTIYRI